MANTLCLSAIVGLLVVFLCIYVFVRASRESRMEKPRVSDSNGGFWTTFWTTCKNTPWSALWTIPWFAPWAGPRTTYWVVPWEPDNHHHVHPDIEDPLDREIYFDLGE